MLIIAVPERLVKKAERKIGHLLTVPMGDIPKWRQLVRYDANYLRGRSRWVVAFAATGQFPNGIRPDYIEQCHPHFQPFRIIVGVTDEPREWLRQNRFEPIAVPEEIDGVAAPTERV